MTLLEVAIITGTSFNERKITNNRLHPWLFSLCDVEVRDNRLLVAVCGRGKTLAIAKKDYAQQLQSKIIIVNAMGPDRQKYLLPPKITVR